MVSCGFNAKSAAMCLCEARRDVQAQAEASFSVRIRSRTPAFQRLEDLRQQGKRNGLAKVVNAERHAV
jgi:hypothetical protein